MGNPQSTLWCVNGNVLRPNGNTIVMVHPSDGFILVEKYISACAQDINDSSKLTP